MLSAEPWLEPARVASETDFAEIREQFDNNKSSEKTNNWKLDYDRNNVRIWRKETMSQLNIVKLETQIGNCSAEIVYDTLHDHEYRKVWDTSMIRAQEIGHFNATNDIGYYAISCPKPIKNRDFVLLRSWLDTENEKIIINRSISHQDYPPNDTFVRAYTKLTGYVIRKLDNNNCYFGYLTQCDPQGKLPIWFVNRLTKILMPQFLKKLLGAIVGYGHWKRNQLNPDFRPWSRPEQIQSPKLLINSDRLRLRPQPQQQQQQCRYSNQPNKDANEKLKINEKQQVLYKRKMMEKNYRK